jgi:hypothetical protein
MNHNRIAICSIENSRVIGNILNHGHLLRVENAVQIRSETGRQLPQLDGQNFFANKINLIIHVEHAALNHFSNGSDVRRSTQANWLIFSTQNLKIVNNTLAHTLKTNIFKRNQITRAHTIRILLCVQLQHVNDECIVGHITFGILKSEIIVYKQCETNRIDRQVITSEPVESVSVTVQVRIFPKNQNLLNN